MATVNIIQGGETAMKAMLFGVPDQNFVSYINNGLSRAGEILQGATNTFMNKAYEVYNAYNSSEAIDKAKRLLYGMNSSVVGENIIYEVPYGQFHNTNQIMRNYIMVHPKVYKMNQENMCYGFQDSYVDVDPARELKNKELYREVMDGVLQEDKEGSFIMHYSTDNELSMYDKFNILHTWDNIDAMIANDLDPTDPEEGEL